MNNWYVIVGLLAVALVIVFTIINWIKLPGEEKINDVKQWLKYAVTEAEKKLQTGTGQLKLRLTYDMFLARFPEIAKFVSFEMFSSWVDEALEWLNNQLESNMKVKEYVYGSEE